MNVYFSLNTRGKLFFYHSHFYPVFILNHLNSNKIKYTTMKKITLLAAMILAFIACNNSHEGHSHGQGEGDEGWSEVDNLHITAMEKGAYLDEMEEAFEGVLKQAATDQSVLKGFSKEAIESVLRQVEKANQDMMAWMENHGKVKATIGEKTDEEVDKIIETERQNIQRITDETEKTVDAANELLKALGISLETGEEGHDHSHEGHEGHEH
jgi:hypothetical protein